ncbi:sensor histidine kinase [Bacillus sp. 1P06AnD]|uniref:sensor histidine kinase n=1 Tax=Bacillus sp. 1P06AnD TaxID=3132208 RepID=UPI0039A07451
MNKISVKLGALFFITVLLMEIILMIYLHHGMVKTRVDEEFQRLSARTINHRNVLQKAFNPQTMDHVVQMEDHTDTAVVITDEKRTIITSTNQTFDQKFKKLNGHPFPIHPVPSFIINDDWRHSSYLSVGSPLFSDGHLLGYIVMFKSTDSIQSMIQSLNEHYVYAMAITLTITLLACLFISRAVTRPILNITEAAQSISAGNYHVSTNYRRKDELGILAGTIETLGRDLQHMNEERDEFLAAVSHELRTPLTYIKGYANLLQKREQSEQEKREYAVIIKEESDRLNDLIQHLFDLAKIGKHSFEIHKEPINLQNFLINMERKLTPAFNDCSISLRVICDKPYIIQGDRQALEQVMLNLLDNARKYSTADTNVTVSVFIKKSLHIAIRDEGMGIPEKDLPFIFNKMYRVEASRSRDHGGFGLGLAIAKELVESHGDQLAVSSELGVGTTFEIICKEWDYEKNHIS